MKTIREPLEFDWDSGNVEKNLKHDVIPMEAEQVFLDDDKIIYRDVFHSHLEERYIILGKTNEGRLLYTVFTMREEKVRIISSRDINKKEVQLYEKAVKDS
jgi:uncharacterized protein